MTNIGFRQRPDAEAALRLVREAQRPTLPVHGRGWIFKTPEGGIPPMQSTQPGRAECTSYYIDIDRLVQLVPQTGPATVEVWNLSENPVPGDTWIQAKMVGNRAIYDWPGGGEGVTVLLVFELTKRIDPVTKIGEGTVTDPRSSGLTAGSTITLDDPCCVWLDLDPGACGIAVKGQEDMPTGDDPPPDEEEDTGPWTIILAQRPTERYRVKINADLFWKNSPSVDWTDKVNRDVLPYLTDTEPVPEIANPLRIDARTGGYIWITRSDDTSNDQYTRDWYVIDSEDYYARFIEIDIVGEASAGGVFNGTVINWADGDKPPDITWDAASHIPIYLWPSTSGPVNDRVQMRFNPNVNEYFWVNDVKYKARWVFGEYTIEGSACQKVSFQLLSICGAPGYWEGENPGSFVDAIFPGLAFYCEEQQTMRGYARYRREQDDYVILGTDSAFMGRPTEKKLRVGNAEFECDSSSGNFCFKQEELTAQVFACPTAEEQEKTTLVCVDGKSFLDCIDVCRYVCLYCDLADDDCDPACCEDCLFPKTDPITSLSGSTTTGGSFSATKSGTSMKTGSDNCTFTVPMSNGTTWTVRYLGDGDWEIDYDLNSVTDTAVAVGDCTMATDFTASDVNFTGSLTAAGEDCEPPPPIECCGDCKFINPGITAVSVSSPTQIITSNGPATRVSDCEFTIPMDDGSIATVSYDGSGGWTVNSSLGTVSGNGNCAGSDSLVGAPNLTGSLTATGEDCGGCCDFGPSAFVSDLTATAGDVTVTDDGSSTRGGMGECGTSFSLQVDIDDPVAGTNRKATATVTLRYDDNVGDCVWDVEIPNGNPSVPPLYVAAAGCEGIMDCQDASGDCTTYTTGTVTIEDPDQNPTCTNPNA